MQSLVTRTLSATALPRRSSSGNLSASHMPVRFVPSFRRRRSRFVKGALSSHDYALDYSEAETEHIQKDGQSFIQPRTREILQIIGVCIAATALCFQVGVLYPWHEQLSEQFAELQELVQDQTRTIADLTAQSQHP